MSAVLLGPHAVNSPGGLGTLLGCHSSKVLAPQTLTESCPWLSSIRSGDTRALSPPPQCFDRSARPFVTEAYSVACPTCRWIPSDNMPLTGRYCQQHPQAYVHRIGVSWLPSRWRILPARLVGQHHAPKVYLSNRTASSVPASRL